MKFAGASSGQARQTAEPQRSWSCCSCTRAAILPTAAVVCERKCRQCLPVWAQAKCKGPCFRPLSLRPERPKANPESQRHLPGKDVGGLHMWPCDPSNLNQQLVYEKDSRMVKNVDGYCLDASQRNSNGGLVHMWPCDPRFQTSAFSRCRTRNVGILGGFWRNRDAGLPAKRKPLPWASPKLCTPTTMKAVMGEAGIATARHPALRLVHSERGIPAGTLTLH